MAKEEEQYSVLCFLFFWFVGVYKVEGKKKSLQIRLFFL